MWIINCGSGLILTWWANKESSKTNSGVHPVSSNNNGLGKYGTWRRNDLNVSGVTEAFRLDRKLTP